MLVHFPSGLYPFSFVMDCLGLWSLQATFHAAATYALEGALAMSVFAMIYGAIDFLQIDSKHGAWKTAGIHALLNVCWFMVFGALLFYRLKNPGIGGVYVSITGFAVAGMIISNYLGGELIIKYKIGIDD
jgi:uncharacterized membrane protein